MVDTAIFDIGDEDALAPERILPGVEDVASGRSS
jgi:hypothetical protein